MSRTDELSADQEIYDTLNAEDTVQVRYWDAGGLFEFARLSQRSTIAIVWQSGVLYFGAIVLLCLLLEVGGSVTIVYRTDRPRDIRLQGGSRTYLWKNPVGSVLMLGGIILFGLYLVFGRRWLSRWWPPQPDDRARRG